MSFTNATDLGPLQILIGTWTGQRGTDIAPEPDYGVETNTYREKLIFNPVRHLSNADEQHLTAVQYHQVVHRVKDNKQIHDQCGYWLWDEAQQLVMHSFTLPRGMAILAGGHVTIDKNKQHAFEVSSAENHEHWPIVQSQFLQKKAKTLSFNQTLRVEGSELHYSQTTVVDIYGKEFEHSDENTLIRQP